MIRKIKNAAFFLMLFLLTISPFFNLNINISPLSSYVYAQEQELETSTEIESFPMDIEKKDAIAITDKEETEGKEKEEESDLSLKAEFITYEKVEGEDLIIAEDGVRLKYQNIEVKSDYLKINLSTNLLSATGKVHFLQDESETSCEELTYNWKTKKVILQRLNGKITGEGIKGNIYYHG
ncbi:MAG: hypothetical protein U9N08_04900, partial [Candidatus Caldatribacteriota bacterium]|nr:hypothetical protein [Candidatus Caldatribacteriota bacterium]